MQANGFTINTQLDLEKGAHALAALDARFCGLHDCNGLPELRLRPGGLHGLGWIVTGQLISARAAQVIWRRVEEALASFEPAYIAALAEADLAALGLTRAKARCIIHAAQAELSGQFSFDALHGLDDKTAAAALMALSGIGRWSADIYLITCLGRSDVWPAGDRAVRSGVRHLLGLERLPAISEMDKLAEGWRPWRSVAARYLWELHTEKRIV